MISENQKGLLDRIMDADLKPPEQLTLMITRGCNLNCRHCLLDCRPAGKTPPVNTDVVKRIVLEFFEIGGKGLVITGGEPLIHPDWLKILSFACYETGLRDVCLQTNAMLMNDDDINSLQSLPADRLSLQISLEGATPGTHDFVRGKGGFEATMKTMARLSAAGLGGRTTVAFTEMRHNYDELPDAVGLVHTMGMGRLVSGTIVKGGRAMDSETLLLPEPLQIRGLLDRYEQDHEFRRIYDAVGNIAAVEWFKGREGLCDQPCTCIRMPFMDAEGHLFPCVMYLKDTLAIGHGHERPLGAVISDAIPLWASLPKMSRRRSLLLNRCQGCPGRRHCAGGCMGRADRNHGNAMSVEDRCDLRREVYFREPRGHEPV